MRQTALLPFRRKPCWGFFSPWKIRRLRPGFNPRTWVPKASTLPLDHRSRLILYLLLYSFSKRIEARGGNGSDVKVRVWYLRQQKKTSVGSRPTWTINFPTFAAFIQCSTRWNILCRASVCLISHFLCLASPSVYLSVFSPSVCKNRRQWQRRKRKQKTSSKHIYREISIKGK